VSIIVGAAAVGDGGRAVGDGDGAKDGLLTGGGGAKACPSSETSSRRINESLDWFSFIFLFFLFLKKNLIFI
jgi:hypothetical protein